MNHHALTGEELGLLEWISKAAFANPFSDERIDVDLSITGMPPDTPRLQQLQRLLEVVDGLLKKFTLSGRNDIRRFRPEYAQFLQVALLFDVFHKHIESFDRLIMEQVASPTVDCPAPFALEAMAQIEQWGLPRVEAERFIGMFYQIRRAYFFIDRGLLGQSPSMKTLRRNLWNNVFTSDMSWYARYFWNRMEDFSTLLLGPTGAGKGAAAAAIGRSGYIPFDSKQACFKESFMRSFTAINLSQFPESLVESELFGHRKGAFTGATEHHQGVLSRCSPHGSVLLDEIGDVSTPVQIKLLQVLQDRTFSPIGSHERLRFHGRVIAATNRSLDDLRRQGRFRDDFFYRLCSDMIQVPSLHDRLKETPSELRILLEHVVTRLAGHEAKDLADMIASELARHPGADYAWPGNVRELEQAARRILISGKYEGGQISRQPDNLSSLIGDLVSGSVDAESLLASYSCLLYERHGSYEEVARRLCVDRRTARKYVLAGEKDK